jgi:hypothetical protein
VRREIGPTNLQDLEGKQWTDGQDILEFHPFQADETHILKHPLARFVPLGGEQQSVATDRPREDGLTHPADTSRSNLAAALALLPRWRNP